MCGDAREQTMKASKGSSGNELSSRQAIPPRRRASPLRASRDRNAGLSTPRERETRPSASQSWPQIARACGLRDPKKRKSASHPKTSGCDAPVAWWRTCNPPQRRSVLFGTPNNKRHIMVVSQIGQQNSSRYFHNPSSRSSSSCESHEGRDAMSSSVCRTATCFSGDTGVIA